MFLRSQLEIPIYRCLSKMMTSINIRKLYHNLHIFADDCLRLSDNQPLLNTLDTSKTLHTIYFNRYTKQNTSKHPSIHRIKFLLESLDCLQKQLGEFGVALYIINGPTMAVLNGLISRWGITRVTMEKPTSFAGKRNCIVLANFLAGQGVKLVTELSSTLYDITKIQPNIKQSQFIQITDKMNPQTPISDEIIKLLSDFKSVRDTEVNVKLPSIGDFDLKEETLLNIASKFKGGEFEAKEQLKKRITRQENILSDTFALSPALNFGCISPRIIHEYISSHSIDPETAKQIKNGLRKRDYFLLIGGQCRNIDNQASMYNYVLPWDENSEHVRRFENGQTGFPIVDAIIAQIKKEGHIPMRLREILATFLTCGMLWLGWHHGAKLFYECSLDYNPSICGLSWMLSAYSTWLREENELSGVNPLEEARTLDLDGEYIKKYLPQLRKFPPEFIHTPWRAPLQIQMEVDCVVGRTYPYPLYPDPEKRFLHCKQRLKVFYALIKTASNRQTLHSLGKRRLECKSEKV